LVEHTGLEMGLDETGQAVEYRIEAAGAPENATL